MVAERSFVHVTNALGEGREWVKTSCTRKQSRGDKS